MIQEAFWGVLRKVPSIHSKEGEDAVGTCSHPNFTPFHIPRKCRAVTYVHNRWRQASPVMLSNLSNEDIVSVRIIFDKDKSGTFINIYNDPQTRSGIKFLSRAIDESPISDPLAVLGDFNLIRMPTETTSNNINIGHLLEFNHTISELGLLEIPLSGRNYTYSNNRPVPTFSRLDRAFWSSEWVSSPLVAKLVDLPRAAFGSKADEQHGPFATHIDRRFYHRQSSLLLANWSNPQAGAKGWYA